MTDADWRDFLLLVRRALLMIVRWYGGDMWQRKD